MYPRWRNLIASLMWSNAPGGLSCIIYLATLSLPHDLVVCLLIIVLAIPVEWGGKCNLVLFTLHFVCRIQKQPGEWFVFECEHHYLCYFMFFTVSSISVTPSLRYLITWMCWLSNIIRLFILVKTWNCFDLHHFTFSKKVEINLCIWSLSVFKES